MDPYLVGMIYGDGSVSKRKDGAYAVWVDQAEKNRDIMELGVLPRFKHLGPKVYHYRYYAKKDKTYKYRALVYSKQIYTYLRSTFNDIESYIDGLSAEDAKAFIAGVFDAEGTFTDRAVIYNSNMTLLKSIQRKLELLAIHNSHIYKFGVVHGLQLYRRKDLAKFIQEVPAIRFRLNPTTISS